MDVIVTKVLEGQRESDRCFLDLETKRMKLKEKIYEMEQQRLTEDKEREEHQRREERDFQLRLFAMMYGNGCPMYPPPPPPFQPIQGAPQQTLPRPFESSNFPVSCIKISPSVAFL